ncbi:MAG: type II toxin-antitoxin system PrlF family antitoxin [Gammaproteobacteria bacterium]|nr:type II toxin-antitoxin system PrlF family antitoxin [Gammaproteobacteria bacterium]
MADSDISIAISKLTSKYQATVPRSVREALALKAGDRIAFEVCDGEVKLRKAQSIDLEYLASVESGLGEWNSDEDARSYDDL